MNLLMKIYNNRRKIVKVLITFLVVLALIELIVIISGKSVKYIGPKYEKVDIEEIINKQVLSDDDYEVLYKQTGLTKLGINRCLNNGANGKKRILEIQESYFYNYTVVTDFSTPYMFSSYLDKAIKYCYLNKGDVIVGTSTNLLLSRLGHAGLVVDAVEETFLQAYTIGTTSSIGYISDFTDRTTFVILQPKISDDEKNRIVDYAVNNLIDLKYSPFTGIFTSKKKINPTQCAHIVWSAYKEFGYDIDGNGGGLIIPSDILKSNLFDVVQIFGYDLKKRWN